MTETTETTSASTSIITTKPIAKSMQAKFEKLVIGMEFPSYKAICEFLETPVLAGDSKKKQLRYWEQYYTWEITGRKWKVLDIFPTMIENYKLAHLAQIVTAVQRDTTIANTITTEENNIIQNVSKLIGKVYKNWQLVCDALCIKNKNTQAQKEEIGRYCDICYTKIGNITGWFTKEVYDEPIPKSPNGNSIYTEHIEKILIKYLIENNLYNTTENIQWTTQEVLYRLGIVNSNLMVYHGKDERKQLAKQLDLDTYLVMQYLGNIENRAIGILRNTLKSMEKRRICLFDDKARQIITKTGTTRMATFVEKKKILAAEYNALRYIHGIDFATGHAMTEGKYIYTEEFFTKACEILRQENEITDFLRYKYIWEIGFVGLAVTDKYRYICLQEEQQHFNEKFDKRISDKIGNMFQEDMQKFLQKGFVLLPENGGHTEEQLRNIIYISEKGEEYIQL